MNNWIRTGMIISAMGMSMIFAKGVNAEEIKGFEDIEHNWAEQYICKWHTNQVIERNEEGKFRPEDNITRGEFIQLINNVSGYQSKSNNIYHDVDKSDWYAEDVAIAVEAGYIKGFDDQTIKPNDYITREEAATMIGRAFGYELGSSSLDEEYFIDSKEISSFAKGYVDILAKKKIISGYEDQSFKPDNHIKRSEAIKLIDNVVKGYFYEPNTITDQNIDGATIINTGNITLENSVVEGNLYLTERIEEGHVQLDNVKVDGQTIIAGGGENDVLIKDCELNKIKVQKKNGQVGIIVDGETSVDEFILESESQVIIRNGAHLKLLAIHKKANIILEERATVDTIKVVEGAEGTSMIGDSKVNALDIKADNVIIKIGDIRIGYKGINN